MNILALDTSTEACSAALLVGNKEIHRFEVKPNQQSHLILPMIETLLVEAGLTQKELDAIAFGCGPGSFTGLRIAASVAQGIAFAHNLPIIPISSLQVMAQAAYQEWGCKKILSAIDAHVQSLYYGIFEFNEITSCVEIVGSERLLSPLDWKYPEGQGKWYCVGTGWHYFNVELELNARVYYPKASAMLILAKNALMRGDAFSAEKALPTYLHELYYLQDKKEVIIHEK